MYASLLNIKVLHWRFIETVHHNLKHAQEVKRGPNFQNDIEMVIFQEEKSSIPLTCH